MSKKRKKKDESPIERIALITSIVNLLVSIIKLIESLQE